MSLSYYRKLPDFNPVAGGARATVLIPRGPTYENITLRYAEDGQPADAETFRNSIEEVTIKINGTERFSVSGKHLIDVINKYNKVEVNQGRLRVPLARPWMRTVEAMSNLAWGTQNLDSLLLEVKLKDGVVNPTLVADARVIPEARDLGLIVEVHEFDTATSTTGKYEISTLPRGNGDLVALHMDNPDITAVEAKLNQTEFISDDADLAGYHDDLVFMSHNAVAPQAGYVHIDAQYRNLLGDTWPLKGVEDFRVNPSLSKPGPIGLVMETLNAPLGLPEQKRA